MFKIWSEWDFGFGETVYETEEKAKKALQEIDWKLEIGDTLEELMEENLVQIIPVDVE